MIQLTRESTVEQLFDAYLELTGDEQLKELRDRGVCTDFHADFQNLTKLPRAFADPSDFLNHTIHAWSLEWTYNSFSRGRMHEGALIVDHVTGGLFGGEGEADRTRLLFHLPKDDAELQAIAFLVERENLVGACRLHEEI